MKKKQTPSLTSGTESNKTIKGQNNMENYNPNNPAYIPTDVSANDLIVQSLKSVYRAGRTPRDF